MIELIKRFDIGLNIPAEKIPDYINFIESKIKHWYKYTLDSIIVNGNKLIFKVKYSESIIEVEIFCDVQPKLTVSYDPQLPYEYVFNIVLNIYYFTNEFYSIVREGNLILVFVPGSHVVPVKTLNLHKKLLYEIFTGSLAVLFALSMIIGIFFFLTMKAYAPLGIMLFQTIFFLLSPKIISFMGDWSINEIYRDVYIVNCHFPLQLFNEITSKRWKDILIIKEEIYKETFNKGVEFEPKLISNIFNKHGFICSIDKIKVKHVPLYNIVVEVSRKFNIKLPKIVLANTIASNAGISGPMIRNATLVITSGLLYKLNDDELKAVLGHEFSHCIRRDPLILFILSSLEYALRVHILLTFYIFPLDLIYFIFALTMLFFIAKFFEARADLDSYLIFGSGDPLVNALLKIAFPIALVERYKAYRIRSWLRWNPHPPIYFRILRLGSLKYEEKVNNPLIRSIKDCIRGFVLSL